MQTLTIKWQDVNNEKAPTTVADLPDDVTIDQCKTFVDAIKAYSNAAPLSVTLKPSGGGETLIIGGVAASAQFEDSDVKGHFEYYVCEEDGSLQGKRTLNIPAFVAASNVDTDAQIVAAAKAAVGTALAALTSETLKQAGGWLASTKPDLINTLPPASAA